MNRRFTLIISLILITAFVVYGVLILLFNELILLFGLTTFLLGLFIPSILALWVILFIKTARPDLWKLHVVDRDPEELSDTTQLYQTLAQV